MKESRDFNATSPKQGLELNRYFYLQKQNLINFLLIHCDVNIKDKISVIIHHHTYIFQNTTTNKYLVLMVQQKNLYIYDENERMAIILLNPSETTHNNIVVLISSERKFDPVLFHFPNLYAFLLSLG
ncbi:hypothetical protein Glove_21g374 [Diversispora epigaea]|uniref:Uncharacterized protein n=1 Tax=Diversispora epigaea TaxID=1348612 RepID=A0A397JJT9_9GLOM|nr:hypothetical protein Glove_21g374 [Diversispora epigaea]